MLQGQESATKEKKAGETTPAENQTLPPKSADSAVPPNGQDETIEVQTPYGPMKVLKKTGQQGPADGRQGPQNLQPSSDTPPAPSATQTTPPAAGTAPGAQASPPAPSPIPTSTPNPPVPAEAHGNSVQCEAATVPG